MAKQMIPENELDNVVGGYMHFDQPTKVMTYYKQDGSTVKYKINKFKSAWTMSNQLHAEGLSEDEIVSRLLSSGYIG